MKNPNQLATQNKWLRRAAATLLGLGALSGVGAVGNEAYQASEAKDAAIERQLETIIDPEIDARGSEALAKYEAQPDKEKGNIHLKVDQEKGVAFINGETVHDVMVGDQKIGSKVATMRIIMGLSSDGKPNPTDTRIAWYRSGSRSLDGTTAKEVQFAAPGSEEYRAQTLPGNDSDGWSASYGGSRAIGKGTMGAGFSSDKRDSSGDEPGPTPAESATAVVEQAQTVVPEVLAELAMTNS